MKDFNANFANHMNFTKNIYDNLVTFISLIRVIGYAELKVRISLVGA